jgi:Tfp pilus assembly protein PilX
MKNPREAFIALYFALVATLVLSGIGASVFLLTLTQQHIIKNTRESLQAYYGAEAGVEDALLRVKKSLNWSNPGTLGLLNAQVTTTITNEGSKKIIVAQGNDSSRIRKIEAVYQTSAAAVSFFYGAQAGNGGVELDQNSTIVGNIYSNGSIKGANGVTITGDAVVAGSGTSGNKIENVAVSGNAWAPSFKSCSVGGNIVFVTGGGVNSCPAGGTTTQQADPIPPVSLPIAESSIAAFKQAAQEGGIIAAGDYKPPKDSVNTIGPGVIQGDMILINNQSVTLAGTVYVKGNIDIDNKATIKLSTAYGKDSGVLLSDGWVHVSNNGELKGSGQPNSYLMILSTSLCKGSGGGNCTHHDAAMDIHNNAEGAIFYSGDGMINLHNKVKINQATAWKLQLGNNASLTYSTGLASALFSSGPGGTFELSSWKEIE